MATATKELPIQSPFNVDIQAHERDKERRRKARDKKRRLQHECLDYEAASLHEARKPVFEYEISCEVMEIEKGRRKFRTITDTVRGHNEDDAWAKFCTRQDRYPSPKSCNRQIQKVGELATANEGD